jgi:outer membrane lipoprotein-sorting protein
MMKSVMSVVLMGTVLIWCGSSLAENLPSADEVIAKHVQALGGMDKIQAQKSRRVHGKVVMGGGQMEAPMVMEMERPNKFRAEFSIQGVTGTQAYDGKTGWFVMPFMGKTDPEKMSPEDTKELEDQADIDGPLVGYKNKGHSVELAGKEDSDGAPAYKLKLTKKSGDVEYYFVDAEHYLILKVKGNRKMQGTDVEYEQVFGDYKPVDGVLMAHSVETRGGPMGGGMTMSIEKVETNVTFPADRFTMPEPKKEEKSETSDEKPKP